jgi:hypothetical protein
MLFYSVIVKKNSQQKKIVFKGDDVWPDALPKKFHTLKKSQQQSHAHDRNFLLTKITQCGS